MRGITLKVRRLDAMRVLADQIRTKTAEFEKEKKAYPGKLAEGKKLAIAHLQENIKSVRAGKDYKQLQGYIEGVDYSTRCKRFPKPPELNVCNERRMLDMLRLGTQEVISINSNHELWDIIQSKCEVIT